MKKPGCGCVLFSLAAALTALGASVIIALLSTLWITSSFFRVFPFGSPIWCGAMVSAFQFYR